MAKKKKDELLYKKDIDSLEKALDYIDKLKIRVNKDRRLIRAITKEKNSLQRAWDGAEVYLSDVTGDKPLIDLIETTKHSKKLKKTDTTCKECHQNTLKTLLFNKYHIVICENNKCRYRENKHEATNTTTE